MKQHILVIGAGFGGVWSTLSAGSAGCRRPIDSNGVSHWQ
jgi:NADH dehydrogenase FAD-containing subunit